MNFGLIFIAGKKVKIRQKYLENINSAMKMV
jgi:hypothetical protein